MGLSWEPGAGKLTANRAALLAGIGMLSPALLAFWFAAPLLGEFRWTAMAMYECLIVLGIVRYRRRLTARARRDRHEEYVSSALRRVRI